MAVLDAKIAEAEQAMGSGETAADRRRAKERREDLMRLKRVEQIYVCPSDLHPQSPPLTFSARRVLCCPSSPDGYLFCSSCSWQRCLQAMAVVRHRPRLASHQASLPVSNNSFIAHRSH